MRRRRVVRSSREILSIVTCRRAAHTEHAYRNATRVNSRGTPGSTGRQDVVVGLPHLPLGRCRDRRPVLQRRRNPLRVSSALRGVCITNAGCLRAPGVVLYGAARQTGPRADHSLARRIARKCNSHRGENGKVCRAQPTFHLPCPFTLQRIALNKRVYLTTARKLQPTPIAQGRQK